ncbi:putative B3 domain-containing protein Os03g0621600 [Hordeum vulgare subsp. vulgare]|nr:putative B3 domain-containing protein Os03g0621600 [Hordeum vulgare subsp. vulgare]
MPGEINLETRNMDSYTIKVVKYQEKHVLTVGWPQFVKNFHLQLGDSLLFRYSGDSLFSIVIFDKLGREKASSVVVNPFPPQVQGRRNEIGSARKMNALGETCEIWDDHQYMNLDDEKKYFLMRMMGDFQDEMIIQKEFVHRFKGEIPGEIELQTKNKCTYKIKVVKNQEGQLVLAAGWGRFIEKFSLQTRDSIILFSYNGKSQFSVIILDQLGREKASSVVNPFPPRALERHTNCAETVSQHPSDGHPLPVERLVQSTDAAANILHRPTQIPETADCSLPLMIMPSTAHFDVHHQQQAMLMQPPLNHSSSSEASAGEGDGSFSSHDHVQNALGFVRVVRRKYGLTSSQKKQRKDGYITTHRTKLTSAQEQQVKDMVQTIRSRIGDIIIFVALMGRANVLSGFSLTIPVRYGEEYFGDGKVICFQLGNKKWNVSFSSSRKDYRVETGWKKFVKDNCLKLGDICLFEPLSNQGSTMEVHIIRVNDGN